MRRLRKKKFVATLSNMPSEKVKSLEDSYGAIITVYKVYLFASPINLLAIPILFYIYERDIFPYITIVLAVLHIVVLEDYFFRRSIVSSISELLKEA